MSNGPPTSGTIRYLTYRAVARAKTELKTIDEIMASDANDESKCRAQFALMDRRPECEIRKIITEKADEGELGSA